MKAGCLAVVCLAACKSSSAPAPARDRIVIALPGGAIGDCAALLEHRDATLAIDAAPSVVWRDVERVMDDAKRCGVVSVEVGEVPVSELQAASGTGVMSRTSVVITGDGAIWTNGEPGDHVTPATAELVVEIDGSLTVGKVMPILVDLHSRARALQITGTPPPPLPASP